MQTQDILAMAVKQSIETGYADGAYIYSRMLWRAAITFVPQLTTLASHLRQAGFSESETLAMVRHVRG